MERGIERRDGSLKKFFPFCAGCSHAIVTTSALMGHLQRVSPQVERESGGETKEFSHTSTGESIRGIWELWKTELKSKARRKELSQKMRDLAFLSPLFLRSRGSRSQRSQHQTADTDNEGNQSVAFLLGTRLRSRTRQRLTHDKSPLFDLG